MTILKTRTAVTVTKTPASRRPARLAKLFRLTGALALAALALCLFAAPAPAAEDGQSPPVTVGDFTFTPPAGLSEGAGLRAFPGLSLNKGVDEKALSPLFNYENSGRHVQFISTKRDEKKPIPALKAVLDRAFDDPKDVYSLGDNYGLGIKGGDTYRGWVMFTKDGSFFYLWLYYPSTDVKALAESFKANTPDAEIILTALKSPQVQAWLNFEVLAPNERMSRDRIVYTVPEGATYEEKDGEVRITSPGGKESTVWRMLPDQSLSMGDCLALAKKACEEENGRDFDTEIDEATFKKGETESVTYECQPRPMLWRVTHSERK